MAERSIVVATDACAVVRDCLRGQWAALASIMRDRLRQRRVGPWGLGRTQAEREEITAFLSWELATPKEETLRYLARITRIDYDSILDFLKRKPERFRRKAELDSGRSKRSAEYLEERPSLARDRVFAKFPVERWVTYKEVFGGKVEAARPHVRDLVTLGLLEQRETLCRTGQKMFLFWKSAVNQKQASADGAERKG